MEIALLSSPTPVAREAERINDYLDLGPAVFHLRKPALPETAMVRLLERISVDHLSKVALHSHHHIADALGITRLHYPEPLRGITPPDVLEEQSAKGIKLSTSVHQVDTLWDLPEVFSYAFLSPIFPSISKQGYGGPFEAEKWAKVKESPISTYGLGGIDHLNLPILKTMGFEGAALMGSIWKKNHGDAIEVLELCLQFEK
jgi:thiamine-phosphate pyrophosphorylase